MERVLRYYGIDREEIIAFGDGENDMEMLQFAGIGVAMENADPEVKEDRGLCDGQRRRGRDHPGAPALQVDLEKENAPAARCGSRSNFYNSKKDTYGTFIFKRANSYRRCFQNFLQSQNQPLRYPMGKRK